MEILKTDNLTFTYQGQEAPAIKNISLSVCEGEMLLLCGGSGSGKTTLLRQIKRELSPCGKREGRVLFEGRELESLSPFDSASGIAYLFQNPDSQIVMDIVRGEIAFSLENLGLPTPDIRRRIAETVGYFGISEILDCETATISGGQKQLVNLCALLAQRPKMLLLDEPLAQLDPVAQAEFIEIISRINRDFGITVIVAEHRIDELLPVCSKVAFMEKGRIVEYGSPSKTVREITEKQDIGLMPFLPVPVRLSAKAGQAALTVRDVRDLNLSFSAKSIKSTDKIEAGDALSCRALSFQYSKGGPVVLDNLTLSIDKNQIYAVLGPNASGKSTLLQLLAGLLSPLEGKVLCMGRDMKRMSHSERRALIGYVPQDPRMLFTCDTVREELELAGFRRDRDAVYDFEGLMDRHPYDLSGGETQMLALCCATAGGQQILLLDEVTKGIDPRGKTRLSEILKWLAKEGKAVVIITHDIEFAAATADRFSLLFDGQATPWQDKYSFFCGNCFYTTAVRRIMSDRIPSAVTLDDLEGGADL